MKRVSDSNKAIVGIPVILKPIEVEVAPVGVIPKISNIAVVQVAPDRIVQNISNFTAP